LFFDALKSIIPTPLSKDWLCEEPIMGRFTKIIKSKSLKAGEAVGLRLAAGEAVGLRLQLAKP